MHIMLKVHKTQKTELFVYLPTLIVTCAIAAIAAIGVRVTKKPDNPDNVW